MLTLVGCGPDFTEAGGRANFRTTLSRLSRPWTPAERVALGSSFTMEMTDCLFCPPLRLDGGWDWTGNQQVLAGGAGPVGLRAVGEGTQQIVFRGADGFSFPITVEAPASLSIHDPIALTRAVYGYLGTIDGGAWPAFPDVGEEVVMGADAGLLLDLFAHGAAGGFLGSSALFAARSDSVELPAETFRDDGRLLELTSGPSGRANVSVMLKDGGLERTWPVRVAGADEVARLELVVVSVSTKFVVRALATRSDGGAFFEPPVEWEFSRGVTPEAYWSSTGRMPARERREVKMFSNQLPDGGIVTISARAGSAFASIDVEFQEEPPPPPPPPMPTGCGCASLEAASPLLLLALLVAFRRPRRLG